MSIRGGEGNVKKLELSIGTIFIPVSTYCILKGKVTILWTNEVIDGKLPIYMIKRTKKGDYNHELQY